MAVINSMLAGADRVGDIVVLHLRKPADKLGTEAMGDLFMEAERRFPGRYRIVDPSGQVVAPPGEGEVAHRDLS